MPNSPKFATKLKSAHSRQSKTFAQIISTGQSGQLLKDNLEYQDSWEEVQGIKEDLFDSCESPDKIPET